MNWKNSNHRDQVNEEYRKQSIDQAKEDALQFSALMMSYFNEGIAPNYYIRDNMNTILAGLPQEEANKMRRKFRKLWRKLVAQKIRESNQHKRKMKKEELHPLPHAIKRNDLTVERGDGGTPLHHNMWRRKYIVDAYIRENAFNLVQEITRTDYNGIVTVKERVEEEK